MLGAISGSFFNEKNDVVAENIILEEQDATIRAIKKTIPAVVSIVLYEKDDFVAWLPSGEKEVQKYSKEIRRGTGFIITSDGYILTNKHVIKSDDQFEAEYKVILNSNKEYYAQFIGKDPINDLAVLKIFDKDLPFVEIGDSGQLELGTSVIAIGNALGVYKNSVTKGVVSGLERNLAEAARTASFSELVNVIQTDAEINIGNSGGPLIDLYGRVVGINVATDNAGDGVGFTIPINDAKPVINSIKEHGMIKRAMLGVRYFTITPRLAEEHDLKRDYGAWISSGESDEGAIVPGGPAEIAGLEEGDIIFEVNAIEVNEENSLLSIIQKYVPGDRIGLKIQRGDKVIIREVELGKH